ncbi:MAG: DUF4114 domain-containing protein [Pseudomonadota bacterium]
MALETTNDETETVVQTGTGRSDSLTGADGNDVLFGEGGDDKLVGGVGDDIIHGGGGNDALAGEGGDDIIFGASTRGGVVDMDRFRIGEDTTATITFEGESAGYRNTLGMYKINDDGSISDVEIVFANASLKGSGGNLIGGESSVEVDLSTGDRVGFFVVPNSYAKRGMADLLNDESASFKFVDADGNPANVNNGGPLNLVQTDAEGVETVVRSQYGSHVFHSITELNGDNYDHVKGDVDVENGTVRIGFEDLWRGGDKDFDDSVFTVDLGVTNAALLPKESNGSTSSDDDNIQGGDGADQLYGMRGNDVVEGDAGNDRIWGNSGDDTVDGGSGDDIVTGGSGNDVVIGGRGNDDLAGNTGNDKLSGGEGNDVINGNSGDDVIADGDGNDKSFGGSGDDTFIAGSGNDFYNGGSGFDTLDYSWSRTAIEMDLSKHKVSGFGTDEVWSVEKVIGTDFDDTMKGDKRDNVLEGGNGNDVIRGLGGADTLTGGEGEDRFTWRGKDVIDQKTGAHLGVDTITDWQIGDQIDLYEIVKNQDFNDVQDVVRVTDGDKGATISVKLGEAFVDVVTLEGVQAVDFTEDSLILS